MRGLSTIYVGYQQIEVPRRGQTLSRKDPGFAQRSAEVSIRFCSITIGKPRTKLLQKSKLHLPETITVNAIWIKEPRAPAKSKGKQIDWLLLTNESVKSLDEALEKVRWYQMRWRIESFHKILKSGCAVEQCRLETADRLKKYLTLSSVIAWRIFWLTHMSRHAPNKPCTEALTEHEWKALYCKVFKISKPPDDPPTVKEVVEWIAKLGGHLGRKCDGEPGITVIWRGWQRLTDIADDWLLFTAA